MPFEEHKVTFQEVDRHFAELKRQHEAGTISDEKLDVRLKQLMVLDEEGLWWSKSRGSGEWHYYDGNRWVSSIPPHERSKPSGEPEPSIHKPTIDELIQVCARYEGHRFYVGDRIPEQQLSAVRLTIPIPADERVAALLDTSTFFSLGIGLAICEEGLRWAISRGYFVRRFLEWLHFADVSIEGHPVGSSEYEIRMDEGGAFFANKQAMDHDKLVQLLREIQVLIKDSPAAKDT